MPINPFIQTAVVAGLAIIMVNAPASAQTLANPGFEQRTSTTTGGWRAPPDSAYVFVLDSINAVEGRFAARIERIGAASRNNVGAISQRLDATALRGQRVRFRASVRTAVPADSGSGHLWLRVDLPNGRSGFFENMTDRPIRSGEWQHYEIVGNVDEDATAVVVGFMLQGSGRIWIDAASFQVVPENEIPPATPEVTKFVDEVLGHMQRQSVRRDSVNWTFLRERMHRWSRGARTTAEYYPALRQALRQLGDNHSFHMPPQQTRATQAGGGSTENPAPVVQRFPNDIGYMEIRAYSGFDKEKGNAYAREAHAKLKAADAPTVCRWIVDLRRNGGGNMWPMMAALGPILGEGLAGQFVSATGASQWGYADGGSWAGSPTTQLFTAKPEVYVLHRSNPVVAVLTAGQTASSGEAVAVAFRQRPNTRTFGQPSYGVSTANATIALSDGSMMLLTTSIFADRTGTRYGSKLEPDQIINEPRNDDLASDPTIRAATQWLAQQPCPQDTTR
jgi:carboxyl-terminal processing protease